MNETLEELYENLMSGYNILRSRRYFEDAKWLNYAAKLIQAKTDTVLLTIDDKDFLNTFSTNLYYKTRTLSHKVSNAKSTLSMLANRYHWKHPERSFEKEKDACEEFYRIIHDPLAAESFGITLTPDESKPKVVIEKPATEILENNMRAIFGPW